MAKTAGSGAARRVRGRLAWSAVLLLASIAAGAQDETEPARPPTLGLEGGISRFETPLLSLDLVASSQTVAGLRPRGAGAFDFTPSDWLDRRSADGFHHLGDLDLRLRAEGDDEWTSYSTAAARRPVRPLDVAPPVLAAADLAPTLPSGIPLTVRRYWEVRDGRLALRFELENRSGAAVEVGGLGLPLVFNNILHERSLDEAHTLCSFSDPYIGLDAGYVQVTRLTGRGPSLVVVPIEGTPFEAYNPLLDDPTPRGVTFEGFYEWLVHSRAHAEEEWRQATPWNPPTSVTLAPGETRSYGVSFLVADGVRDIEPSLARAGRPVAVGIPGYVLPMDLEARLHLEAPWEIRSMEVDPPGALTIEEVASAASGAPGGWRALAIRGRVWGRARLTIRYAGGREQTVHYKVIEPASRVLDALGHFLTTEQWFERPDDPFGRSPSIITYDIEERRQVTEDDRVWIAGLGDEGGGGAWLAAVMKQLARPDPAEVAKIERFVDEVVWGGLQYAEGERMFGVKKSLFYWEPEELPDGTYSDDVDYGGWQSWDREHALSVVRSYDYPHVTALHWVLYRLARDYRGLVTHHAWEWYLERSQETAMAMVRLAPEYSRFGQMEGTVFTLLLEDLRRESWSERAAALEAVMKERADHWRSLDYPYGSEMPWDSTGQEEVYAWSRHFGYAERARVTLDAILGYMPTVPHWGYNGSARRYWDFQYAGKLRRIERQLHHYGSGLNAIPVLSAFREQPGDLYLLRVGYGGLLGSIANITREGFGPAAFHAYPSTLRIDGISGDFGPGLFGHVVNTGTYLAKHPALGWMAFGGNLSEEGGAVRLRPLDSARARVHLAEPGLWLTLDAGSFEELVMDGDEIRLTLSAATPWTPTARLRLEQPATPGVGPRYGPVGSLETERGAYLVPLQDRPVEVTLAPSERTPPER